MQPEYRSTAQETWDAIAESFDTTRNKPWEFCLEFIESLNKADTVADLGCGNGRHLFTCAKRCSHVIGVDLSLRLLRIVEKKLQDKSLRNVSLVHADVVHLPFADNSLDAVLFIASLHNIQGSDHRRAALKEVCRVLRPKGTGLVSVWSRWQDRFFKQTIMQTIIRPRYRGDVDIYWRTQNLNIPRFYHLYGRGEFLRELQAANLRIDRVINLRLHSKRFPDNYVAVIRKR